MFRPEEAEHPRLRKSLHAPESVRADFVDLARSLVRGPEPGSAGDR